jgi:hypothetical protein
MNLQFYLHEAYRIAEERWHIHQRNNPHSVTDEDAHDFIDATVEMVLLEFIAEKENTILKIEEYVVNQIDYFAKNFLKWSQSQHSTIHDQELEPKEK